MSIQSILMGILPSVGVALLFFFVIRGVIRADRNERAAIAAQEARNDSATDIRSSSSE